MLDEKKVYFAGKKLIKWYEYTMEDDTANSEEELPENTELTDEEGEEEIDIQSLDMSDDDKDLIESIMAKFKDAHQDSVDLLFAGESFDAGSQGAEMSEEELIESLCIPKQNTVDDLVNKARG